MASTRKSAPADSAPVAALHRALGLLRDAAKRGVRIAIALSGGRDSMALLHAAWELRAPLALDVGAVHVHHGLCEEADAWTAFCSRECARRSIPLAIHRVHIDRKGGESLEAAARDARYAVLRGVEADAIALAHHADDQAETVLLQLARGAGPRGLAAMPEHHESCGRARLLRPFLKLPASALDAYARARGLEWIDDPSNWDTALRRNALRHDIVPRLRAAFPGYPDTLVRAARHQAECSVLLDDLAAIDATQVVFAHAEHGPVLDRRALAALARTRPDRARNLLRWFMREQGLPMPSAARLDALVMQVASSRQDAQVQMRHAGAMLESHRHWIVVHAGVRAARPVGVAPAREVPYTRATREP